jgi:hypothetical protein
MSIVSSPVSNFVTSSVKEHLGGKEGLDLHEIAKSLQIEFKHAKRDLTDRGMMERMTAQGFSCVPFGTKQLIQEVTGHSYEREVESFVLDIDAAKFFVAKYNNPIGDAYLAFLIKQESRLETLLSDPENAVKVFQRLADIQKQLNQQKELVVHTQALLTSSQRNTASQTRKVHALEAELRQINRMVSMAQWTVLRRPSFMIGIEPKKITQVVREMIIAQGHEPLKQTIIGDKWPSWTFKISWLDENTDRIASLANQIAASTAQNGKVRSIKTSRI